MERFFTGSSRQKLQYSESHNCSKTQFCWSDGDREKKKDPKRGYGPEQSRANQTMKKYIPRGPCKKYSSPLFTHFHKFNGKYTVLNGENLPETDDLRLNPYARLLSSPLRVDRYSRYLAVPRALLLKMSILRNPKDDQLWLIPNVLNENSGNSSSYTSNKMHHIKNLTGKNWPQIASLELLTDTYNVTTVKDVEWNDSNWTLINKLYIEVLIEELKHVQAKNEATKNDLVIHIADNSQPKYLIKDSITFINLSKYPIQSPNLNDLYTNLKGFNQDSIIIDSKEKYLIDTFIKFISYNED